MSPILWGHFLSHKAKERIDCFHTEPSRTGSSDITPKGNKTGFIRFYIYEHFKGQRWLHSKRMRQGHRLSHCRYDTAVSLLVTFSYRNRYHRLSHGSGDIPNHISNIFRIEQRWSSDKRCYCFLETHIKVCVFFMRKDFGLQLDSPS